ncbi:ribonuclease H1 isoform X2 [Calliopsis andreniformis]|uniref:ribonuclease H1 isoform X2 n=1 Tax=Calliopsis andreniformis TaxID=337506 RepID=UPI003FCDEDFE
MKIIQLYVLHNILRNMAPSYYAVAKGRNPGIYSTWDQCKEQVHQYSGPVFKKFNSQTEAENFIKQYSKPNIESKSTKKILQVRKRLISQVDGSSKDNNPSSSKRRTILLDLTTSISTNSEHKESSDYIIDNNGYVNVYTDGACSSNGGKNPRAGIGVWFGDNHPLNVSQPVVGRATNNMAEIQAVTIAAKQAKEAGIGKLKINTDSKFLLQCIQNWMPRWKANGWKTINNKPVINKTELLEMEEALTSLTVDWNHVNGHVGIYGNEMADKLARAGCLQYEKH